MSEIEKHDFNLNISRYISTAEGEEKISLEETNAELVEIESSIQKATNKHNGFLKELGLGGVAVRSSDEATSDPANGFPAAATLTSWGGRCSNPLLPGVPATASALFRGCNISPCHRAQPLAIVPPHE
jgi:hypothetical protein